MIAICLVRRDGARNTTSNFDTALVHSRGRSVSQRVTLFSACNRRDFLLKPRARPSVSPVTLGGVPNRSAPRLRRGKESGRDARFAPV